jgi:peptidoglycan/LPS O-acetylase OafA/YrhL
VANTIGAATAVRPRFEFLDGLRGIAALVVVLTHMLAIQHLTVPIAILHCLGTCAHFAVVVFIVLSGYCLMMPVVASSTGGPSGGVLGFFIRRARRILPPYYLALFAAMAFDELVAHKHGQSISRTDALAHLLLVHNFSQAWWQGFSGPLWSVAVEWQIYFLMPFVFLPIWRRAGSVAATAAGFAIGYMPHLLLPANWNLDWSCPWFAGLFALGMLGASATFSRNVPREAALSRIPWNTVAITATVSLVALYWYAPFLRERFYLLDPVCGLAAVAAIVHSALAMRAPSPRSTPLIAICESKIALIIGSFSYSLYLIHMTILEVFTASFGKHLPTPDGLALMRMFVAGPIILLAAYGFYRLVEKPFMTPRRKFRFVGIHRDDLPAPVVDASQTAQ